MTRFQLITPVHNTLEIKKSQFITWLLPLESKEQAKFHLQQAKEAYPDARHHCWAYQFGDSANSLTAAMSDDGEPSGTAGKPMLNVLQHKPVSNVMVIVIRYFGGVKLGAGGLVRAYSQAVEQAFGHAQLIELIPKFTVKTTVPFADEQWLRHQTDKHQGNILTTEYNNDVAVELQLPQSEYKDFKDILESRSLISKILEQ